MAHEPGVWGRDFSVLPADTKELIYGWLVHRAEVKKRDREYDALDATIKEHPHKRQECNEKLRIVDEEWEDARARRDEYRDKLFCKMPRSAQEVFENEHGFTKFAAVYPLTNYACLEVIAEKTTERRYEYTFDNFSYRLHLVGYPDMGAMAEEIRRSKTSEREREHEREHERD